MYIFGIFFTFPMFLSCLCAVSLETTTSQTVPVLNSTKQPLPGTTSSLVAVHQNQTLPTDDDDEDDEGEDLPSDIVNASRSPRPIQPLSSSDLEEKLRRLTETMEKIQRGDQDERDVVSSKEQNSNGWTSRSFEHSGNRPPWDQSDDEDEPYHGSGSGDSEPTHPTPDIEDDDTVHSPYPKNKYNRKQTTSDRPSSGHCPLHDVSIKVRALCAALTTVMIYRWMPFNWIK